MAGRTMTITRFLRAFVLAFAVGIVSAQACPGCASAVASGSSTLPGAVNYSIIFMLAMPLTLVLSFGSYLIYLANQQPIEAIPSD